MATEQSDNFLGKGWSFPPAFKPELHGVVTVEKQEDIEQSLRILLTTAEGERIMQPKYGCNLHETVFEAMDTTTKTIIKDKIQTAILYFEPRIDVVNIAMNTAREPGGEVLIEIAYVVRATNSRYNVVFPFYRNGETNLAV